MRYLFIGGEADGQRIEVNPDCLYISIPTKQYIPMPTSWPPAYPPDAGVTKHESYRREAIRFAPDLRIELFVHIDLTPYQAMERLLAHYAPSL